MNMEETTKDQRTWAMIAHLSAFSMYFSGIGHLVGPLIVWLAKKEGNPFVDDQGKEALNFQITITLFYVAAFVLIFTVIGALIGVPALFAIGVYQIIFMIIAGIKANEGIAYRYPLTLRLIS